MEGLAGATAGAGSLELLLAELLGAGGAGGRRLGQPRLEDTPLDVRQVEGGAGGVRHALERNNKWRQYSVPLPTGSLPPAETISL